MRCCWSQGAAVILRPLLLPHPCQQMKSISSIPALQTATQALLLWKPLLSMQWRLASMPAHPPLMQVCCNGCATYIIGMFHPPPPPPLPSTPLPSSPHSPMSPTLPPHHLSHLHAHPPPPSLFTAHIHSNLHTCLMAFHELSQKSTELLVLEDTDPAQQTLACMLHGCMHACLSF